MILLYTMSSIYHGLSPKVKGKKVLQILDHCSIFLLIAGSYTPFTLCTLREENPITGWVIFGVIWGFAILGIVLNSIDLKKYKKFSMICYLVMGWCIIIKMPVLPELLGIPRLYTFSYRRGSIYNRSCFIWYSEKSINICIPYFIYVFV